MATPPTRPPLTPAEYGWTSTGTRTRWPASPTLRCAITGGDGTTGLARSAGGRNGTCSTRPRGRTSRHQPTAPISASSTPTTLTIAWVTRPPPISVTPRAVTMGHTVDAGSSMVSDPRLPRSCEVFMLLLSTLAAHHIDHRQDHNPHAIHEMPVPGHQFRR